MWDFHLFFSEASFIPLHTCSSTYGVQFPISTREGAISPKIYTSASLTIFNLTEFLTEHFLSITFIWLLSTQRAPLGGASQQIWCNSSWGLLEAPQVPTGKTQDVLQSQWSTERNMGANDWQWLHKVLFIFFRILRAHLKKKKNTAWRQDCIFKKKNPKQFCSK